MALLQSLAALAQGLHAAGLAWAWPAGWDRALGAVAPSDRSEQALGALPRLHGLTPYHTVLGALLAVLLPILPLALPRRRAWLGLALPVAAALALSGARGSWLATLAGAAVALAIARSRPGTQRRHLAAFALLALALPAAGLSLRPARLPGLTALPPAVRASLSLDERDQSAAMALALWRSHPWLGVGSGQFAVAARRLPAYARAEVRIVPVHNWLLRLAEGGAIGAALAVVLWVGPPLWLLLRGKGRGAALLGWSLTALAVSQWTDYELLYWLGGALLQALLLALWAGHARPPPARPLASVGATPAAAPVASASS